MKIMVQGVAAYKLMTDLELLVKQLNTERQVPFYKVSNQ